MKRAARHFSAAIGLITLITLFAMPAVSWSAEDEAAVDSAGEALRERMQIPWYDAESDALKPVEFSQPWQPDWDLSWMSWLVEPLNVLLVSVVILLVAVLVWVIIKVVRDRQASASKRMRNRPDALATADHVEALPFMRDRPQHDLLGQARHHYEQGNYSEAIIYLFSYELVQLDRFSLVRLEKGKTNRQYLREAGRERPLAGLLERTMVTFEDVFFGRRALDRAGFEVCWNQLDQFERLVAQAQSPA
jgi:hypothetical protein